MAEVGLLLLLLLLTSWRDNPLLNPGPEAGAPSLPPSCCREGELPCTSELLSPSTTCCTGVEAWDGDCHVLALDFLRAHSVTLAVAAWVTPATMVNDFLLPLSVIMKKENSNFL